MAVISVNVGPKRVWLTAYCPEDALGIAACQFLLGRVGELLSDTPDGEFRGWLIAQDPAWVEVLRLLDEGFALERTESLPVSPGNVGPELRIIEAIRREAAAQRRMRR
jgi:hypothetical protein